MHKATVFSVVTAKKGQVFEGYSIQLAFRSYNFYAKKKQPVFMYKNGSLMQSNVGEDKA